MKTILSDVVVIGGGVAGLTAANSLADMGMSVSIVEKSDHLGGHAAEWACMATDKCNKCSACTIQKDIESAHGHAHIQAHFLTEVTGFKQADRSIEIRLSSSGNSNNQEKMITCQSVIISSGFKVYDPSQDVMLSYKRLPEVLKLADVDESLKINDLTRIFPGQPITSKIAFIMCVGSRDRKNKRDYCSQFCGRTSVRMINRMKYLKPDYEFDMYYIDLQIMCKEFSGFQSEMRDNINFYQGIPAEVLDGPEKGTVKVYGHNAETGNFEERVYDRIVLATGISPDQENYRLGKLTGIPVNQFGFFEHVHDQGALVSPVPGVFLAGASAGPADIVNSRLQAMAAAGKAAQYIKSIHSKAA